MNLRWNGLAIVCACIAAATAHSQDSPALEAAKRDLDRLVSCRQNYDYDCTMALTYEIPAAARSGVLIQLPPEVMRAMSDQARAIAPAYPTSRLGFAEHETPGEAFVAGTQLFSFVPYRAEGPGLPGTWREVRSYLIGVSDDAGMSWRFANGSSIEPETIGLVIPGYSADSLPVTEERIVEVPDGTRSEYLRTVDAYFQFDGESAAYGLVLDVRKRITAGIDLAISFDDPSNPDWPRNYQSRLSPGQQELKIDSPAFRGFVGGEFYDVVIIGSDGETGAELFEHRQSLLFGTLDPPSLIRNTNGAPPLQSVPGPR